MVVQISAAVGAAFLIPSLASSVNEFNTSSHDRWAWQSMTVARDAGLPFPDTVTAGSDDVESGIYGEGELADWQIDVYGLEPDTAIFDPRLSSGRWIEASSREAVLSAGFAERNDLEVGDTLVIELASGEFDYELVGLSNDFSRTAYLDRADLAADLGEPGMVNTVWSFDEQLDIALPAAARTSTAADLAAEDNAGRAAIVTIFGAIGVIVAGVAALAVLSSMTVSLFERRHELAAMQALGARRRRLRGLLIRELLPLGAVGLVGGLALGSARYSRHHRVVRGQQRRRHRGRRRHGMDPVDRRRYLRRTDPAGPGHRSKRRSPAGRRHTARCGMNRFAAPTSDRADVRRGFGRDGCPIVLQRRRARDWRRERPAPASASAPGRQRPGACRLGACRSGGRATGGDHGWRLRLGLGSRQGDGRGVVPAAHRPAGLVGARLPVLQHRGVAVPVRGDGCRRRESHSGCRSFWSACCSSFRSS